MTTSRFGTRRAIEASDDFERRLVEPLDVVSDEADSVLLRLGGQVVERCECDRRTELPGVGFCGGVARGRIDAEHRPEERSESAGIEPSLIEMAAEEAKPLRGVCVTRDLTPRLEKAANRVKAARGVRW